MLNGADHVRNSLASVARNRFKITVLLSARRAMAAVGAPLLVLLIVVAFMLLQVSHQERFHVVAATSAMDHPAESGITRADRSILIPPVQASHRQVTDRAALAVVQGLSRYEIRALRRQAYYGDDSAALIMGMLYETGRHVPQSCTKAADWVLRSANWGNAAAQYNLGLRYRDGDGVPANEDEAKKWLRKSADHKYSKASLALEAMTSADARSTYAR